jgi:tetratricopeptide (TPR) repeat protein
MVCEPKFMFQFVIRHFVWHVNRSFRKPGFMFQFVIRHSSFVILFALLFSLGCHKKAQTAVPSPPESKTPPLSASTPPAVTPQVPTLPKPAPAEPISLPKTDVGLKDLELGEADFQDGNYQKAALSFEAYLSINPKSENRDKALFYLGLSRALASDSGRNARQTEAVFKQLISQFPDSPYKVQAEYILGLQAQIERLRSDVRERDEKVKKLSEELQKLKEIDMQRRPSRPPE